VAKLSGQIIDFTGFLRAFRNKILPMARSMTKASPEPGSHTPRELKSKDAFHTGIAARLFAGRLSEGGALCRTKLVTIRGERFVIPIKVEQKRRVQGVVHGASSSGQTVFVEPLEKLSEPKQRVWCVCSTRAGGKYIASWWT